MIEKKARVIRAENHRVWVRPAQSSCESCQGGCHAMWRWFCRHEPGLWIENTKHAQVGDTVIIAISEQALVQGSVWAYLVPLLLLLIGAWLGQVLDGVLFNSQRELITIAGGVAGLFFGFGVASWKTASPRVVSRLNPVMVRRIRSIELATS